MGYFKNINFSNYRNFTRCSLSFDKSLNIILGKNGSGKTNILEGISLFEKGRGFRKEKIANLINFNNFDKRFNIDSKFQDDKLEFIVNVFNSEKNLKKISINESLEKETIKHFESAGVADKPTSFNNLTSFTSSPIYTSSSGLTLYFEHIVSTISSFCCIPS